MRITEGSGNQTRNVVVTLMCTFLVKAESGGCGYVGRYEERLVQQESGAALSNSTYVSGLLLYKVCIN